MPNISPKMVKHLCSRSVSPWDSALQDTKVQRNKLMGLYIKNIPSQERIILAGDHTAWSRPNAATLKERTYEHHTQSGIGGRPVTAGYGYSTLVWVPEEEGSWALPLVSAQ